MKVNKHSLYSMSDMEYEDIEVIHLALSGTLVEPGWSVEMRQRVNLIIDMCDELDPKV